MIDIELYRIFYVVAKSGSFTKASDQLFLSQPALSQSIKQLEKQLGIKLFTRTHKGVELSENGGKLIYANVEQALKLLEEAEEKVTEMTSTPTGLIRVGATDSIFSHVLANWIVKYKEQFPQVKIELVTGTSPETIAQLKASRVDVAFLNLPINDVDINLLRTVSHLSDVFVAGKKFERLKGKEINIADLEKFPLLMIESNTVARHSLNQFTETLGVTLTPDIEVDSWDFMMKLVSLGMGIGCIPREYCKREIQSGELFEVNVTPSLPMRGIGIAVSKDVIMHYALKEFVEMFTNK